MEVYTLWQFAKVFVFYVLIIFAIPAIVLYDSVADKKFTTRFFIYFSAGNFYIINLVYLLEICHISYRPTLIAFTVLPAFFIYMALHRKSALKFGRDTIDATGRLAKGSYGIRNWFSRVFNTLKRWTVSLFSHFGKLCSRHIADIILIAFLIFLSWGIFGQNMLHQYGYCTSDIVVHNWWINAMNRNEIFVNGIYPYGFHNIAYYIHAVFGVETYDVLRTMWFGNYIVMILGMLCFLRGISKTKYLPYLGVFLFVIWVGVERFTFSRYYNSLPQEYSMVYILPSVYFAIEFFKIRKQEVIDEDNQAKLRKIQLEQEALAQKEDQSLEKKDEHLKKEKDEEAERQNTRARFSFDIKSHLKKMGAAFKGTRENGLKGSTIMLLGVGCNFAMSFSTHFYATMVIGFLFVAIAVGYFIRFVRKDYFGRVMGTVFLSILVALLPMIVAFAMGTPLQGSLGWGMSVINGSKDSIDASDGNFETDVVYTDENNDAYGTGITIDKVWNQIDDEDSAVSDGNVDSGLIRDEQDESLSAESVISALKDKSISIVTKLKDTVVHIGEKLYISAQTLSAGIIQRDYGNYMYLLFLSVIVIGILAIAFFITKNYERAMLYLTLFMMFVMLAILADMPSYHLPSLMDNNRWGCFGNFLLWIFPVMAVDGFLYLILGMWNKPALELAMYIISVTLTGAGMVAVTENDMLKDYLMIESYESNGTLTCITNIRDANKDFTWTLVSANDETQMVEDHGFHYELAEFLRRQEYYFIDTVSDEAKEKKKVGMDEIHIPTRYIYILIEKKPIGYGTAHEDANQPVSEEYASSELPEGTGLFIYQLRNRNVTMSRAYYWAQEFMKLYPGELSVFYEDDANVCYVLHQNEYSLYNFAINYGYNMVDYYSPEARQAQAAAEEAAKAEEEAELEGQ